MKTTLYTLMLQPVWTQSWQADNQRLDSVQNEARQLCRGRRCRRASQVIMYKYVLVVPVHLALLIYEL